MSAEKMEVACPPWCVQGLNEPVEGLHVVIRGDQDIFNPDVPDRAVSLCMLGYALYEWASSDQETAPKIGVTDKNGALRFLRGDKLATIKFLVVKEDKETP